MVSDFQQNARIVVDKDTNKAIMIDPGANVEMLFQKANDFQIDYIVLTHCHIDHAGGVQALLELFKHHNKPLPKLAYHNKDSVLAQSIEMVATMYGLSNNEFKNVPKFDLDLATCDVFKLGNSEFKCLFTPGHAPGHICLFYNDSKFNLYNEFNQTLNCNHLLIGGDTLFYRGHGRTDLPYCNHDELMNSIRETLLKLPDDTLVCSGHGQNTTIKNEKVYYQ